MLSILAACILVLTGCGEQGDERLEPATEPVEPVQLETADLSGEAPVTRDEFVASERARGSFHGWDTDGDQQLTNREFDRGVGSSWDPDSDRRITEGEWEGGATVWFGTADYGAWYDWDADGNATLNSDEVASGLDKYGLFNRWDQDGSGTIGMDEFLDSGFGIVDENGDGEIGPAEWNEHSHHLEPTPG